MFSSHEKLDSEETPDSHEIHDEQKAYAHFTSGTFPAVCMCKNRLCAYTMHKSYL